MADILKLIDFCELAKKCHLPLTNLVKKGYNYDAAKKLDHLAFVAKLYSNKEQVSEPIKLYSGKWRKSKANCMFDIAWECSKLVPTLLERLHLSSQDEAIYIERVYEEIMRLQGDYERKHQTLEELGITLQVRLNNDQPTDEIEMNQTETVFEKNQKDQSTDEIEVNEKEISVFEKDQNDLIKQ
jgi:hypothetical protein